MTDYIAVPTGVVKAEFFFLNSPLPANTPISFVISNIGNPASTKPVKVTSVKLFDDKGVLIPELTDNIPTFSMK